MKGATNREVPSALAMAMLLGASSPKTTCKKVMVAKAKAKAMASVKPSGTEKAMNRGSRRCLKAGSPIHPSPSEEMVIPSWQTERYESSLPVASLRSPTERLPSRASRSTCVERIFTSPNSAATNRPFRATKNSARTTRRASSARLPNPYPRFLRLRSPPRSPPAPQRAPFLSPYSISRRCPVSYADQQRIASGRHSRLHSPRAHPRQTAEGVGSRRSSPGTYPGMRWWEDHIPVVGASTSRRERLEDGHHFMDHSRAHSRGFGQADPAGRRPWRVRRDPPHRDGRRPSWGLHRGAVGRDRGYGVQHLVHPRGYHRGDRTARRLPALADALVEGAGRPEVTRARYRWGWRRSRRLGTRVSAAPAANPPTAASGPVSAKK